MEDESYFWTLSRYIHLNPARGKRPLVAHPRDWNWSSYSGYCEKRKRHDWVAYEHVLSAWQGEMGGKHPDHAYRRFVESGIDQPPKSPLAEALDGWLLGSESFLAKVKILLKQPPKMDQVPKAKALSSYTPVGVIETVAEYYQTTAKSYQVPRSMVNGRDLAAWMAHRKTTATLRDLASHFGLSHPESVSNLIRRAESELAKSARMRKDISAIEVLLDKTVNRV